MSSSLIPHRVYLAGAFFSALLLDAPAALHPAGGDRLPSGGPAAAAAAAYQRGDYDEAARIWRQLAEEGSVEARLNLGALYEEGKGVRQSDLEAVEWYRRAAERRAADPDAAPAATTSLDPSPAPRDPGLQADYAQGVAALRSGDYALALDHFRPLAVRGDTRSQLHLATMHLEGKGLPANARRALRWYRRAAAKGRGEAMLALAGIYFSGQGLQAPNLVRALMWYELAARQAPDSTEGWPKAQVEDAARRRDELARILSADQLAAARRLAEDWRTSGD